MLASMCGRCGHDFHVEPCQTCRFDQPPHPACPVGIDPGVFACQILDQISRDFRQFLQLAGPVIMAERRKLEDAAAVKIHRV